MSKNIGRRNFLKTSMAVGGAALLGQSFEEKVLSAEIKSDKTPASATPLPDALNIPKGKIKNLELSRIICGGNLISGWAHSRDLIYVSPLVKAYHTKEKVFETLRLAERRGINTVLTNPVAAPAINAYWKSGGKIQWISDCASGSIKDGIQRSVDNGACAVYLQGGYMDKWVKDADLGEIETALTFMQKQKVPCGLGAHCLETVRECVLAGFEPDFWMKTLHRDNYWSATPAQNRRIFDEVNGDSREHDRSHDNMWCIDAKETIDYMATLKKPWIAFKTLAAGAIHPRNAFQWCLENGADFLCVGMFDFQIVENTAIAAQALEAVAKQGRSRPWMV
jgi:hypothetical protein